MQRMVLAGLLATLSGAATVPARAELHTSSADVRQTVVQVGDLDLSTPQGAAALRTRLDSAAKYVCGPRPQNPLELGAASRFRACVRETFTFALAQAPHAGPRLALQAADAKLR